MSLQKYCMKNIDLLIFLINLIDHSADMKIASWSDNQHYHPYVLSSRMGIHQTNVHSLRSLSI